MAVGAKPSASSVKSKSEKLILPFRRFVDRPLESFVHEVLEWLRISAMPEAHEALFRNSIPKDVKFIILRKDVVLDGTKRPDGDNAPCPMCATNKFLRGSLVYVPEMQCCAFIGNCCADSKSRAEAERDFRQRSRQDYEDNYLLDGLPLISDKLDALNSLMPAAKEAQRMYRQFRRGASLVQHQLRQVKRTFGPRLVVSEMLGDEDERLDYHGPAGFRGGTLKTREHDFGPMEGELAIIKDYKPVNELEHLIRQLSSIDPITDEDQLLEFITTINEKQRHAGVVILEAVDTGVIRFIERLRNFYAFFTPENAARINAFGTCEHNTFQFTAEYRIVKARPTFIVTHRDARCVLCLQMQDFDFSWPRKKD